MRPPLIRQGEGPAEAIQRYYRELNEQQRKIERICNEIGESPSLAKRVGNRSAEGDPQRLRGLPAIGRGVRGATDRSVPHVHGIENVA